MAWVVAKIMMVLFALLATSNAQLCADVRNLTAPDGKIHLDSGRDLLLMPQAVSVTHALASGRLSVCGAMTLTMNTFPVTLESNPILFSSRGASISGIFALSAGVVYPMNPRPAFVELRKRLDLLAVAASLQYDGFRHVLFPSQKDVFRAANELEFAGGSLSILPKHTSPATLF